jgi:hypothetical protein
MDSQLREMLDALLGEEITSQPPITAAGALWNLVGSAVRKIAVRQKAGRNVEGITAEEWSNAKLFFWGVSHLERADKGI